MILQAGAHIAWETIKAYVHMAKVEYGMRRPLRFLGSMGFLTKMLGRFALRAIPAFSKTYHPKKHPLVTDRQNPIQVAWRHYHQRGGNVLEIDRKKMAEILDMQVPEAA